MATTVKIPEAATSNVPTYQQAYDMSADWLSRTVKTGQDSAATAAQAKDYYMGQDQGRQSVYDQLKATSAAAAAAAGTGTGTGSLKDSQDFAQSALNNSKTVSFKSTKSNGPSDFDAQMMAMQSQGALNDLYKGQDAARQFSYDQQSAAQAFKNQQALANSQNAFSASEAEKQRQLQAYLGNIDANTRLATSMFGSLSTNPAEYRYW